MYEPDIICLQEVEAEQFTLFFHPNLAEHGYVGKFHAKSRARTMDEFSSRTVDGCVIFWKEDLYFLFLQTFNNIIVDLNVSEMRWLNFKLWL